MGKASLIEDITSQYENESIVEIIVIEENKYYLGRARMPVEKFVHFLSDGRVELDGYKEGEAFLIIDGEDFTFQHQPFRVDIGFENIVSSWGDIV